MAARSSGSKVVSVAVAAIVGTIGIGSVYLPFVADRDKMRGLHEEQSPPTSAMLAQEIKKLQKEGLLKGDDHEDGNQEAEAKSPRQSLAPGSMWGKFRKRE